MAVYVDEMIDWNKRIGNGGPRWCHMVADTPAELHAMARAIGLRRSWFQDGRWKHYDLGTDGVRGKAIARGAFVCDRETYIAHARRCSGLPPRGE